MKSFEIPTFVVKNSYYPVQKTNLKKKIPTGEATFRILLAGIKRNRELLKKKKGECISIFLCYPLN